jgi:hypothetical protein
MITTEQEDNVRAKTEQATEILELKAQLAEVMPLAKLAALLMKNVFPDDPELFAEWCMEAGCFDSELNYKPNIEATIKEFLK